MLKSTSGRKKYTTAGCGGCDKYELCPELWTCDNVYSYLYLQKDAEGYFEEHGHLMGTPQVLTGVGQLETAAKGETSIELHPTLQHHLSDILVQCPT